MDQGRYHNRDGGAIGDGLQIRTLPDIQNVDDEKLDPVFWDFSQGRAAQKRRFPGELFPAQLPEGATGRLFVEFFQVNKLTGEPRGIVGIRLRGGRKR